MLKRPITYTDFDGNEVTEEFYFNLTRVELTKLKFKGEGMEKVLQEIIQSENIEKLIEEMEKIVLGAYGERSEDGKRFVKSDELAVGFSQTAAYDQLFHELTTNDKMAADFIMGVMPKDLAEQVQNELPQDKPQGPPPTPVAPPLPPSQ